MRALQPAVPIAFAAFIAVANAAPHDATNIAEPISRADFENRIWEKDSSSLNRFVRSKALSRSDDIYKHIAPCEVAHPCPQNVYVAGTGYLKGSSGPKNTVRLPMPSSSPHLAILSEFVRGEGLTNAYFAVFDEAKVLPKCQIPIAVPSYEYGSWLIRGVYPVSGGPHLVWLEAGGGDGGFVWSLNVFLQFTSECVISHWEAHYVSAYPDGERCTKKLPELNSFFAVRSDGRVRQTVPRPSCLNIKIAPDRKIRVGARGT